MQKRVREDKQKQIEGMCEELEESNKKEAWNRYSCGCCAPPLLLDQSEELPENG